MPQNSNFSLIYGFLDYDYLEADGYSPPDNNDSNDLVKNTENNV